MYVLSTLHIASMRVHVLAYLLAALSGERVPLESGLVCGATWGAFVCSVDSCSVNSWEGP